MKKTGEHDDRVPVSARNLLDELAKLTDGKSKRVPLHTLLKRAADQEEDTLVRRIALASLFIEFVEQSTTNTEVVAARKGHALLGNYLDDIEYRLDRYREVLASGIFLPPIEEPVIQKSKVTFIIQRGGG